MSENEVTVMFDENGSEYTGYFTALAWSRLKFDVADKRSIEIDGVKITLDECINSVNINGREMTISESWEYPQMLDAVARS